MSGSPERTRSGSSSRFGRHLEVVLALAKPSDSFPSKPLPEKEIEALSALSGITSRKLSYGSITFVPR
ncbi:hypothetical protein PHISCL_08798 [Aspergillus sclerotialis]|uniref:Uncharacterized protein n=1 Tax=Aspergillus sclerotialis TaxID=2070753 RepID=A0A3A2Z9G3_9EURO|nr:hypothetical protein PHISCL_08798 [Aspergillus sclerotialis]